MDVYGLLASLQEKIVEKCSETEDIQRAISAVKLEEQTLRQNSLSASSLLSLESQRAAAEHDLQLLREKIAEADACLEEEDRIAEETESRLKKAEMELDSLAGFIQQELELFETTLTSLLEEDISREICLMGKEDLEGQRWYLHHDIEKTEEDTELEAEIGKYRGELQKAQYNYSSLKASVASSRQAKAAKTPSSTPIVSPKSSHPSPPTVADKFKTASELRWGTSSGRRDSPPPGQEHGAFAPTQQTGPPWCLCTPPRPAVTSTLGKRKASTAEHFQHSSSSSSGAHRGAEYWVCANTGRRGKGVHQCGFLQAKSQAQP